MQWGEADGSGVPSYRQMTGTGIIKGITPETIRDIDAEED